MIVGDFPASDDWHLGQILHSQSAAGREFDNMLRELNLARSDLTITAVCRERSPSWKNESYYLDKKCTQFGAEAQRGLAALSPISATSTAADKLDASWVVRAGLSSSMCLSLESKNFPGGYLRQTNRAVYQQQNDGGPTFAADATFCLQPGKSGQGQSLSWIGDSSLFLRHYNGQIYLASNGGANPWDSTTSWTADVSWQPTPSWAS